MEPEDTAPEGRDDPSGSLCEPDVHGGIRNRKEPKLMAEGEQEQG